MTDAEFFIVTVALIATHTAAVFVGLMMKPG